MSCARAGAARAAGRPGGRCGQVQPQAGLREVLPAHAPVLQGPDLPPVQGRADRGAPPLPLHCCMGCWGASGCDRAPVGLALALMGPLRSRSPLDTDSAHSPQCQSSSSWRPGARCKVQEYMLAQSFLQQSPLSEAPTLQPRHAQVTLAVWQAERTPDWAQLEAQRGRLWSSPRWAPGVLVQPATLATAPEGFPRPLHSALQASAPCISPVHAVWVSATGHAGPGLPSRRCQHCQGAAGSACCGLAGWVERAENSISSHGCSVACISWRLSGVCRCRCGPLLHRA